VSEFLEVTPVLDGWLAKNNIRLTENFQEEILSEIEKQYNIDKLSEYNYNLYLGLLHNFILEENADVRIKDINNSEKEPTLFEKEEE
jgi:hypothetical protein